MSLFDQILESRGLIGERRQEFLHPDYESSHDPFLLPDMQEAVDWLVVAHKNQQKITIYGDYDIDGLTATTVLLDSFEKFGFEHVDAFIPNRFREGYGLTVDAVERIAATGAEIIITVDCGSLSKDEIIRANELGVDVIVTDHHNVLKVQPPAVAVINPKRLLDEHPEMYENYILRSSLGHPVSQHVHSRRGKSDGDSLRAAELASLKQSSLGQESPSNLPGLAHNATKRDGLAPIYPFLDLPGVGVAFKLVQALQTRLDGLPAGQEKWLLDLVALGTVCDVVTLQDENRMHVYWGLQVLSRSRRPGLKALMAVAGVDPRKVTARDLGFGLGPRMNAAGRLETAQYALDMLRAADNQTALESAQRLDEMNRARRAEQDDIFKEALVEAEKRIDDPVLVVSGKGWNHGIIGIVAAKLLEKYKKPTFVLEEIPAKHKDSARALEGQVPPENISGEAKGSARSYGDFSAADAIRSADGIITKGGGHKLAAGVTLPIKNIQAFREQVNNFYKSSKLIPAEQRALLLPSSDATGGLADIDERLIEQLATMEPFGSGNDRPIIKTNNLMVEFVRRMGAEQQHVKLTLSEDGKKMDFVAFNAPAHFFVEPGDVVNIWYQPDINEWQGRRSVEGRLLHLEID